MQHHPDIFLIQLLKLVEVNASVLESLRVAPSYIFFPTRWLWKRIFLFSTKQVAKSLVPRHLLQNFFLSPPLLSTLKLESVSEGVSARYSSFRGVAWWENLKTLLHVEERETREGRETEEREEAEFRLESARYRKEGNSQNIKMNPQMTWGQADAWAEARSLPCILQACTLSSPANLRANLKSISPPARPETLGTYVPTNYSVRGVINVLLNYRRVFDDWRKSIKHAWRCPSSRIVNPLDWNYNGLVVFSVLSVNK